MMSLYRSYAVELIVDQLFFILGFFMLTGLFELTTDGNYDNVAALSSMIGWLTWRVSGGCMRDTTETIAEDTQWGVLEQIWISGQHPGTILAARCTNILLYYTLRVLIMAAVIMPVLGLSIPLVKLPGLSVIYLITVIGAFGLAFALAGLHLVFKNVNTLTYALATILLFLSGAIGSLESVPWLYTLSRSLPLSIGMALMRDIVQGTSFTTIIISSSFAGLMLNTLVYLCLGLLVLFWAQSVATRNGSLAHY